MTWKSWILKKMGVKKLADPFDPKQIKRILVVRNARIGDAVCVFPMLRELKKGYPHLEIDVYAGRHSDFLFRQLPYVNHVYTKYKKRQFLKTLIEIISMKRRHYDLIINAMPMKFELEISLFWMNPRWMIGLGASKDDKQYEVLREELSYYDKLKIFQPGEHMVDYLCGLLSLIGIDHYERKMEFPYDEDKYFIAQKFVKSLNTGIVIGLNVDSSSLTRNLYEQQIVEIVSGLHDYQIVLLSLPERRVELETIIAKYHLSNCQLSYQTNSIFDVAALLRVFDLLISPDTSTIHIASAVDIPTVGIYRNDDQHIALWGPLSTSHEIIRSSVLDNNTLEGFSTQDVVNKSIALINANK
jgi:ADP-heptose:LPS heptosyltransferase